MLALTDYGNISTDPDSVDYRSPVSPDLLITFNYESGWFDSIIIFFIYHHFLHHALLDILTRTAQPAPHSSGSSQVSACTSVVENVQ